MAPTCYYFIDSTYIHSNRFNFEYIQLIFCFGFFFILIAKTMHSKRFLCGCKCAKPISSIEMLTYSYYISKQRFVHNFQVKCFMGTYDLAQIHRNMNQFVFTTNKEKINKKINDAHVMHVVVGYKLHRLYIYNIDKRRSTK